jgi:phosphoribosyl 1,2-cyclic phosphodiesterase
MTSHLFKSNYSQNTDFLHVLGSSSSGNCALITTPKTRVLIDAGFSGRKIQEMLSKIGLSPEQIDAVFITHEHSDHTQGLRGLCKYQNITWISNRYTFDAIDISNKTKAQWSFFETGSKFIFRDLEIETFSIPHDAQDPVGYIFSTGGTDLFTPYQCLAWVLDVGYITTLIEDKIQQATQLVIEANYDAELLENDIKRPWSVKQRIMSRHGHLSNAALLEFLNKGNLGKIQEVLFAHISKDCNSLDAIRKTMKALRSNISDSLRIRVFNPEREHCEDL